MTLVTNLATIALGASIGATLRWSLAVSLNHVWARIPVGTLLANLVGGLLIGMAYSYLDQYPNVPQEYKIFFLTGFLGSLTTFSAFSVEMHQIFSSGRYLWMGVGIFIHVVGSITLTGIGYLIIRLAIVR